MKRFLITSVNDVISNQTDVTEMKKRKLNKLKKVPSLELMASFAVSEYITNANKYGPNLIAKILVENTGEEV